jgi:hypothetical protein
MVVSRGALQRVDGARLGHEEALGALASRLNTSPTALLAALASTVEQSLDQPSGNAFSEAEAVALKDAGVNLRGPSASDADPVLRTAARVAQLASRGLTVAQFAERTGVTQGRIRQRLVEPSLYAFRMSGDQQIADWQLDGASTLPGLDVIVPAIPRELHPLAIENFMTRPNGDLEVDGEALSPAEWLRSGGSPSVVADLVTASTIW